MNLFGHIKDKITEGEYFNIVFYGASTTAFEHVFPNWADIVRYKLKIEMEYAVGDYKKAFWNIRTFNQGRDGVSSQELLDDFENLVLKLNPKLIFLSIGKNDPYYEIDKEITRKNSRELIKKALKNNTKVVFMTTVPAFSDKLNKKIKNYVQVDREVAQEFSDNENFIFIDLFSLFPGKYMQKSYTFVSEGNDDVGIEPGEIDPVHYNKFGNAQVAKILLEKVFEIKFDTDVFLRDLDDPTKMYPGY